MLAYHFCERIAKQVSPWEYIITQADVDEARAAWLELDAVNARGDGLSGPPPPPEVDEVETAMAAAISEEIARMALNGPRLPDDWAPRLAKVAKQASDEAICRYLEREEPGAYEDRAARGGSEPAHPEDHGQEQYHGHVADEACLCAAFQEYGDCEHLAMARERGGTDGPLSGGSPAPQDLTEGGDALRENADRTTWIAPANSAAVSNDGLGEDRPSPAAGSPREPDVYLQPARAVLREDWLAAIPAEWLDNLYVDVAFGFGKRYVASVGRVARGGGEPEPFDGLTDAEVDQWPDELHRLRAACYVALDKLPDDEPRVEAATDAVDQLCRLAASGGSAGAATEALHQIASEVAHFAEDAGSWCESGVYDHGSAWHLTVDENNRWDVLTERLRAALAGAPPQETKKGGCPKAPYGGGCVTSGTGPFAVCAWCGKPMGASPPGTQEKES